MRKVEVISELGLITDKEKATEQSAIEKSLGISQAAASPKKVVQPKVETPVKETEKPTAKESIPATSKTSPAPVAEEVETVEEVQVLIPEVLSPFAE